MTEKKPKNPQLSKGTRRRRKPVGRSTGLAAGELQAAAPPGAVAELHQQIETDGGRVLSVYRESYGGQWLVLAALPIELVEPTPYQRNTSDTHVRKLEGVIGKIGRFLDPIITVRIAKPDHAAKYCGHRTAIIACLPCGRWGRRASSRSSFPNLQPPIKFSH